MKEVAVLESLDRHRRAVIENLAQQIREMTVGDFVDKYAFNKEDALRSVVSHDLRPALIEQSVRKRCVVSQPARPVLPRQSR